MAKRSSPPVLPSAPVDLLAVASRGCEVILAWSERGVGVLGFHIERAVRTISCSTFVEIGEVEPHVTAFRDGFVDLHAAYSYRIIAWNASGHSLPSNVVEVTMPPADTKASFYKE